MKEESDASFVKEDGDASIIEEPIPLCCSLQKGKGSLSIKREKKKKIFEEEKKRKEEEEEGRDMK